MRRLLVIGALAVGASAIGTGQAYAQQYRTYMLVPGIPGSAIDENHKDWIEVLSMSQGVSSIKRSVACSDVSIMKVLDQAGPALWAAAAVRQVFPEVRIEVVKGGEFPGVVYDIRISNSKVVSSQTSGSSELPVESVSFSYDSITLTFNPTDVKGVIHPGTPQTVACQ
jgi:type VI secretion system secreted protein Hcp